MRLSPLPPGRAKAPHLRLALLVTAAFSLTATLQASLILVPEPSPSRAPLKAATMNYRVNQIEVVPSPTAPGRKMLKLDVTLTGDGHAYFVIPVSLTFGDGKAYYVSSRLKVEKFPEGGDRTVGLGCEYFVKYGKGREMSGADAIDKFKHPGNEWRTVESLDLNRHIPNLVARLPMPSDSIHELGLKSLYLLFTGNGFNNDRAIISLDALEINDAPQKEWPAVQNRRFPEVEAIFPVGIWGSAGGYSGLDPGDAFKEKFPAPLWHKIPAWKKRGYNTIFGEGLHLQVTSPHSAFENLRKVSSIFEENHLSLVPLAYLSRYYKPEMSAQECEAVIKREIALSKDAKSILAWVVIDEPSASTESLEHYLEAKRAFESVDPNHPATTGGWGPNALFDSRRPLTILDWYPIQSTGRHPHTVAKVIQTAHRDSAGPVWFILQAFNDTNNVFVRPTPEELNLMIFSALANGAKGLFFFTEKQRPSWLLYPADEGFMGAFDTEMDLSRNIAQFTKTFGPVLPLLPKTTVNSQHDYIVEAANVPVYEEETTPALQTGLLQTSDSQGAFLVVYNNDTRNAQVGKIRFATPHASFNLASLHENPSRRLIDVHLPPGAGQIHFIGNENDFKKVRASMTKTKTAHAREMLRYEAYFASLSKVIPQETIERAKAASSLNEIQAASQEIQRCEDENTAYRNVEKRLHELQEKLADLSLLYHDNLKPKHATPRYMYGKIKAEGPVYEAYVDQCQELGALYYALQNLFLKGQYAILEESTGKMVSAVALLHSEASAAFSDDTSPRPPTGNLEVLQKLRQDLMELDQKLDLPFPRPGDLFEL